MLKYISKFKGKKSGKNKETKRGGNAREFLSCL